MLKIATLVVALVLVVAQPTVHALPPDDASGLPVVITTVESEPLSGMGTFTVSGEAASMLCDAGTFHTTNVAITFLDPEETTFDVTADQIFICEGGQTFVLKLENTIIIGQGGIPGAGVWTFDSATGFDPAPTGGAGVILAGDSGEIYDGSLTFPTDVATVEPGRLLDTRSTGSTVDGRFVGAGKVQAGTFTKVQIAGRGGVAADAVGVELNLTAIQSEGRGFATLYPCTAMVPTASSLNYTQGVNIANATTVALNSNGEVCVFSNVTAHYALDVVAYIAS